MFDSSETAINEFDSRHEHIHLECPNYPSAKFSKISDVVYLSTYGNQLHCVLCRKPHSMDEVVVHVNDYSPTFEAETISKIYEMDWFHATVDPEWHLKLEEPRPVHVGGFEASIDRGLSYYARNHNNFYIYRTKIKTIASISSTFLKDKGVDNGYNYEYSDFDVYRYINKYEDPCSISLVANSVVIDTSDSERKLFTIEEAKLFGTLHSLDESLIEQRLKKQGRIQ